MKLCGFVILLSVTVMFLNLNQSYAQVPSSSSSSAIPAGTFQDFYKHGNDLFDQGNYQDAIIFYDKALGIDSANINALYNKALALDKLGKLNEAISSYDKVLAITPNDTDTLNNKGTDLESLGKHDEAISYYNKVLTINAKDTIALYNTGVALDSLGKHDKAATYYDRVLAIDPTNVDALNKMNLTFNNVGKKQILGIQQLDQTSLLVIVGLGITLVATIVIINLAARRSQKRLGSKVSETSVPMKKEEESTRIKIQDDNEWKGI